MATKTRQELAREAQIHLEETISAAYLILSSMSDELCDANLWPSSSPPAAVGVNGIGNNQPPRPLPHVAAFPEPSDSNHLSEFSAAVAGFGGTGGSLDEARHRYKSSMAALRTSVNAIFASSSQDNGKLEPKSERSQFVSLEEHASSLRKEIEEKNKHVKVLIDQIRDLITNISMWQSPCSL